MTRDPTSHVGYTLGSAIEILLNRLVECHEYDEAYQALCDVAATLPQVQFTWLGVSAGGAVDLRCRAGDDRGYLEGFSINTILGDDYAQGPTARALIEAKEFVTADQLASQRLLPWRDRAVRTGVNSSGVFPIVSDGRAIAALSVYSLAFDAVGPLTGTLKALCEATALCVANLRTQASERRRRELDSWSASALSVMTQGIIVCDATKEDLPVRYVSPSCEGIYGYSLEEFRGRNMRFVQGPDTDPTTVDQLRRAITARQGCEVEILNYRKDGATIWVHLVLSPVFEEDGTFIRYVGLVSDATTQRAFERRMIENQRMEAISTLAGGIAHDFNNLLLVIQGYLGLLSRSQGEKELSLIDRVQVAIDRATELTGQLLAYSRNQHVEPQPILMNEHVADSVRMVAKVLGENVKVTTELNDAPVVFFDATQLHQILLNLLVNARDAMPSGGTILVRTSEVVVDRDDSHGEIPSGTYALVEVIDEGEGMTSEVRAKVFDPFFTTKPAGTGLGLASVQGIVRQAGGHIDVESVPGAGARFYVYLPLYLEGVVPVTPVTARWIVSGDELRGVERVLCVEDQEDVLALLVGDLTDWGYDVIAARSAEEALELVASSANTIDVLVSDVILPGENGRELAERLVTQLPELQIIFTSGYPAQILLERDYLETSTVFIAKPYRTTEIARAIRTLRSRLRDAT